MAHTTARAPDIKPPLGPGHTTAEMTATAMARWRFISHTTHFVMQT